MRATFLTDKDRSEIEEKIKSSKLILASASNNLVNDNIVVLTPFKDVHVDDGMLICYETPFDSLNDRVSYVSINGADFVLCLMDGRPVCADDVYSAGDIVMIYTSNDGYDGSISGTIDQAAVLVGVLKKDSNVELTAENIIAALTYTPADANAVPKLTPDSIVDGLGYTPANKAETVSVSNYGTAGQFAVSDGNGGITWITILDSEEVAY